MTVSPKQYATVTLTEREVELCKNVVRERQAANEGRSHSRNYRVGAQFGAIDTSEEGAFRHEVQSVAVEVATAKWLGKRKTKGSNTVHSAGFTFDAPTHRALSKTHFSTDVWILGQEGDSQDFAPTYFPKKVRTQPVFSFIECKKVNKTSKGMDLLGGDRLTHGGSIRNKDIVDGKRVYQVVGQASEDFKTVILVGWYALNSLTYDYAEIASYDPTAKQGKRAWATQVRPMMWLPAVAMPLRITVDDVQEAVADVLRSLSEKDAEA